MEKDNKLNFFLGGALVLAVTVIVLLAGGGREETLSGVNVSNEYQAVSIAPNSAYGATSTDTILKSGQGTLGSFVISGSNSGVINFYDATTTSIDQRAAAMTTTTIGIASIPMFSATGTYMYDAEFTAGLYLDFVNGTAPTSTVTFR